MLAAILAAQASDGAKCLDDAARASLIVLHPRGGELRAVVAPAKGGELVSLQVREGKTWRELLHRGLDFCAGDDWTGKAPILWPATGRNYAGDPATGDAAFSWTWNGQRLPMPPHGFARDQSWTVVHRQSDTGADSVTLRLVDSAVTRAYYPFAFRFEVTYRLSQRGIVVDHEIRSGANGGLMPFSIGNHITFRLPLHGDAPPGRTTLTSAATTRVRLDRFNRPAGAVKQPGPNALSLIALPRRETIPLAGYRKRVATAIIDEPGYRSIEIRQSASLGAASGLVRFNLWGDAAAGWYSVEPWYGLQNSLATGDGVVRLSPGQTFRWTIDLAIKPVRTIKKQTP